ncbi:RPM1 interacting protein 4 transcript 2 [Striga asiatica]|uniref:RPM1 interacting protein 4 transcript 2 n=1 Tax=Striga asiatica TaxID=4170 RepID=A0A5A7PL39_STRAF|nr:RPM1 interacting protein 4 transcript 2 [Striga asiatica]
MARPNVPKFGNWEKDGDIPYTVCFDNARKNRNGGKMLNPNDPCENPDMFPNYNIDPSPRTTKQTSGPVRPTTPQHGDQSLDHGTRRGPNSHYNKVGREIRSNNASPAHNPVRSQTRPARGDQTPGKGAVVPKFGAWNESDPSSENFTDVFNQVRNERNTGSVGNPPATPKHPSYNTTYTQLSHKHKTDEDIRVGLNECFSYLCNV